MSIARHLLPPLARGRATPSRSPSIFHAHLLLPFPMYRASRRRVPGTGAHTDTVIPSQPIPAAPSLAPAPTSVPLSPLPQLPTPHPPASPMPQPMGEQSAQPAIDDEETRTVVMARPRRTRAGTGRDTGTGAQNAATPAEPSALPERLTQPTVTNLPVSALPKR